ncbi:MAG: DUF2817 domain-containing protein [Deltaproteobacteria bacterium]|nr:DUF2817 domain-containing protein [Deltaproteobacteria bacterium]
MTDFREIAELRALLQGSSDLLRHRVLCEVEASGGRRFPVVGLTLGSEDRSHPTLGLFGGVHGLERIGSRIILAWLVSFLERIRWDEHARRRLETLRIVAIPVVNPGGVAMFRRGNPAGVDLMRNAPVESLERNPFPFGGHRLSPRLWYYRGREGDPMEPEARALTEFVQEEMFSSRAAISLDFHSGFGFSDRLWYPYAKMTGGFPRTIEVLNLAALLDATYPQNTYRVEAQSVNYTTHGDLWDWLFDLHLARHGADGPVFIPWTLELGSWNWVRKNPRQLLTFSGAFNPTVPHRLRRVMRGHLTLCDFFLHAVHNPDAWARKRLRQEDGS